MIVGDLVAEPSDLGIPSHGNLAFAAHLHLLVCESH